MSINLDRKNVILRAQIDTIPEECPLDKLTDKISKFSIPTFSYEPPMPTYTPPICKRNIDVAHDFTHEELGLRAFAEEEIDLLEQTRGQIKETKEEDLTTFEEEIKQSKNSDDLKAELEAFKEAFLLQHLGDVEAWEVVDDLTDDLVGAGDINQIAIKLGNLRKQ